MDLLHRLPKAALVTVVAFLFFGGTVGMVVASGQEPLPESLSVREPHVGDRWEYRVIIHDAPGFTGEATADGDDVEYSLDYEDAEEISGFEWLPGEIVYDRDGVPRHVQPLLEVEFNDRVMIDVESRRMVAYSYAYPYEENRQSTASILGVIHMQSSSQSTGEVDVIGYVDAPAPCGFFSELQGMETMLDAPVEVLGGCLGFSDSVGATLFHPMAVENLGGLETVSFEANDGVNATRLWYAPEIPYPVRMEFKATISISELFGESMAEAFDDDEISIYAEIEMTGFEAGEGTWGEPVGVLPPTLMEVETAPLTRTGPNDEGVVHPFKLSEAYDGALADLMYTSLRDWMADHPDASMVKAKHWVTSDGDYDVHSWSFTMWDSPEEGENYYTEVEAERRIARAGTPASITQSATGPDDSYSSSSSGFSPFMSFLFQVANLPEQAPTVQSAMGRFDEANGAPATTYGFDYTCVLFCIADSRLAVMVGRETVTEQPGDPVTGEPGTVDIVRHMFHFDEEGRLALEERKRLQQTTWTAGLLGSSGATPESYHEASAMPPASKPIWSTPPPEATAGVGFVAFIIGAFYWFWPAIKAVPFLGGFSRVRSDKMLENPVRAAVLEAIREEPGIHYQGVSRAVGKGGSVVDHHLRKLHQGGYITIQKGPGYTCFFVKGEVDHRIMVAVPTIKAEGASRILRELLRRPGQNVSSLAESMGIAKSTVSYHVSRLRKADLLEDGRTLIPTDDAKKVLAYAA